ncbi:patatin-like phospholipase family protein [Sphingomonas lenta]|uniref:Patatin n=1 Tax=Sphingomonas lenta TaxID=1141887 RepID=A0A2A2SFV6_9SPHN|nr:patatin-like phospholipase family protein [Sphingomonas lenta]PAX08082.1 patatin [Sphingomonas lenta]
MADRPYRIALVLSGGNALGSWQAGAFEAMAARGLLPDRVSGASIGAVNGAMIVGNPPERAVELLCAFWSPASARWPETFDAWRRTAAVSATLAAGRMDAFTPRPFFGQPWASDGAPSPSLFDTRPLKATLERSVDWDRVNDGPVRFTITAVELESGLDAVFDSERNRLGPDHVRASTALMPAFPPVEIGGRWYVDPGLSANLPADAVLAEPGDAPLLVIALDLLPLSAPKPATFGEATGRLQDLVFAAQTKRAADAWKTVYDLHGPAAPAVTLARLSYSDQGREVAGKAFDFSPETAGERWAAGAAAMHALIDRLEAGDVPIGEPGLTVVQNPDEAPLLQDTFRLKVSEKAG